MAITSQGSISVSPGVPAYAAARAKQLGLERNIYFSILLHNYLHGPAILLPVFEPPARLVKVRIQLTMPKTLRIAATKEAARWQLTLSTLVESLVILDADSESTSLVIQPIFETKKPELM